MLLGAAWELFFGIATHVLGDQASGAIRRRGDGSVTIPLSVLQQAITTHETLVGDSITAMRELTEAIKVLQQHHQVILVEAPTLAVQVPRRALTEHASDGAPAGRTPPQADPTRVDKVPPPPPEEPTSFRRRMREAYPTTDLDFS